jgi:hypothetical protein
MQQGQIVDYPLVGVRGQKAHPHPRGDVPPAQTLDCGCDILVQCSEALLDNAVAIIEADAL